MNKDLILYSKNITFGVFMIVIITYLQTILSKHNKQVLYKSMAFLYGFPLFFLVFVFMIQTDCTGNQDVRENIVMFSKNVILWCLTGIVLLFVGNLLLENNFSMTWYFNLLSITNVLIVIFFIFWYSGIYECL